MIPERSARLGAFIRVKKEAPMPNARFEAPSRMLPALLVVALGAGCPDRDLPVGTVGTTDAAPVAADAGPTGADARPVPVDGAPPNVADRPTQDGPARDATPTPTPRDATPGPGPQPISVRFDPSETRARFEALQACGTQVAGSGYVHLPLRRDTPQSSFVRESWCRGVAGTCQVSDSLAAQPGVHVVDLSAGVEPESFDPLVVYGTSLGAISNPEAGWGASVHYSEGGRSLFGDGFGFSFRRFGAEVPGARSEVSIGSILSYRFPEPADNAVVALRPTGTSLRALLLAFLGSADKFRTQSGAYLDALQTEAESQLQLGTVKGCARYSTPSSPSVPKSCLEQRPLTEAERTTLAAAMRAELDARRKVLVGEAADLYAAAERAFPLSRCVSP
jgi:hypothetical protein